ncbi:MAG: 2-amino-4-hydroxy-6-hydroxymethyldihydropteridine diphosphokinase [Armatimonadota bacterium]|nr:2-amino-4-hydroxy-6-hydroxymethyldihydropteridine diphosphokinase [Armatimonadota bacterium]MDR7389642.1 2-amino-4-hydroxy-6-hydroxymethyldihydropteridine diphosphokinase [Armatimonadota bacterium]MDR7394747.1 2-amino-4-hydroxy-6-hydroxymethyldihydropteridine diphosphokinase [Armatimonadota bacterium]MDR7396964.1 2-amino-4-hydroxy-6-hydroxymethyldihydropteridine diphosphokinase [Armatimonadota bacterium]MDR7398703.1 2-amino-4-hydroxy-6-hydroxymethyldihydropteridine diphosphokinase [Armatimon
MRRVEERVFLSLGSNLGEREANLLAALRLLDAEGVRLVRQSSWYETEPVGFTEQPPFLNLVVEVRTALDPLGLLRCAQRVEAALGRVREVRWGPRTVDVDLVLYGQRVVRTPELIVPHPRMRERAFVLVPLCEIAPDLVLPDGTPVVALLPAVADQRVQRR